METQDLTHYKYYEKSLRDCILNFQNRTQIGKPTKTLQGCKPKLDKKGLHFRPAVYAENVRFYEFGSRLNGTYGYIAIGLHNVNNVMKVTLSGEIQNYSEHFVYRDVEPDVVKDILNETVMVINYYGISSKVEKFICFEQIIDKVLNSI